MTDKKPIHITDVDGNVLYTRLYDDGSNVLTFASGFGHVSRDTVKRQNLIIREGWHEHDARSLPANTSPAVRKAMKRFWERVDEINASIRETGV
jgi:hypothetical protein